MYGWCNWSFLEIQHSHGRRRSILNDVVWRHTSKTLFNGITTTKNFWILNLLHSSQDRFNFAKLCFKLIRGFHSTRGPSNMSFIDSETVKKQGLHTWTNCLVKISRILQLKVLHLTVCLHLSLCCIFIRRTRVKIVFMSFAWPTVGLLAGPNYKGCIFCSWGEWLSLL